MSQYKKRTLLVAIAIVFLVVLVLIKTKIIFSGEKTHSGQEVTSSGLTYDNEVLSDLVNKDTDGDGVLDWEESLWGTDPKKKDTNGDGIPDNIEIERLKKASGQITPAGNENLTKTDQFSQELFATITALNQTGAMDQATVDKLTDSLASSIQNAPPKKVFSLSDLTISANDTAKAIENYGHALSDIQAKYPIHNNVQGILQKFIVDDNNVDISVLSQLDPIIDQTNKIIAAMVKMSVPKSISAPHLDMVNALERLVENTSDMKLYGTDPVLSMTAISQYDENTAALNSAISNLSNAINKKLSN